MIKFEFLDSFEKRMHIVGAIDSIINRKNKNLELENKFNAGEIENVIFSVLVYIMDKTLSEDEQCTILNISNYLKTLLEHYSAENIVSLELANYIIKDILQNRGERRIFNIMNYNHGMSEYSVRLISDKIIETEKGYKIIYFLTEQGYDFLFRTKEVDDEISFTIEEFKLRELIKRKNYKKALNQSKSLIQMVRQKKNDILIFIQKIKENIYFVNVSDYEKIIKTTYELLQEEYETMEEIKKMIKQAENRLNSENNDFENHETLIKAKKEIRQIKKNIETTINEQQSLILNRHNLSKIYINTIGDSFAHTIQKRFDIETEIIRLLEKIEEDKIHELWKLFNPLFKTDVKKYLNILKLYDKQSRLREEKKESNYNLIQHDEFEKDIEKEKAIERNKVFKTIIQCILTYGISHKKFRLSQLMEYIKEQNSNFEIFLKEHRIFKTMLRLYETGEINLKKWKDDKEDIILNISGEFDISYCLFQIEKEKQDLYNIQKFKVSKKEDLLFDYEFELKENEMKISHKVTVNDYLIEVDL
ncbi:MAG: hypothetical protein ACQESP_02090 [Candidatus Muiribacteriota bacterium]